MRVRAMFVLRVVLSLSVVLSDGCVFGGGPLVGVSQHHGVILGGEAVAGVPFVQFVAGGQGAPGVGYLRLDAAHDWVGTLGAGFDPSLRSSGPLVARIGGGVVLPAAGTPEHSDVGGMFVAGLGAGTTVGTTTCHADGYNRAVTVTIDLRYAKEWQIVLAPRFAWYEAYGTTGCK